MGLLPTNLKSQNAHSFYWDGSSVGEHTTEARGVEGSIPSRPILFSTASLRACEEVRANEFEIGFLSIEVLAQENVKLNFGKIEFF